MRFSVRPCFPGNRRAWVDLLESTRPAGDAQAGVIGTPWYSTMRSREPTMMTRHDLASAARLQPTSAPRSAARASKLLTVLLVLPAAALLLTPFGLVVAAAAEHPDMLQVLVDRPLMAVQLIAGLVVSLLFCALPFRRFVTRSVHVRGSAEQPQTGHSQS